jgi:hypothetical protein
MPTAAASDIERCAGFLGERIEVDDDILGVRSVPGDAEPRGTSPDLFALPPVADGNHARVVAPWNACERGVESPRDVLDVAGVHSRGAQLDERLTGT